MRWLMVLLWLITTVAVATPDIRVSGLFSGKALLQIDGQTRMLSVGETSPEGVKLLACDSQQAEVEVDGQKVVLGLSKAISSKYKKPERREVRINRGDNGHFETMGRINGKPVKFMVDTGATAIAMSLKEAKRLGINYRKGDVSQVNTASGISSSISITLDKVSVGGITLRQVQAVILMGDYPQQVLLGNSFLKLLEMKEERGVLVLSTKY